jgi:hypothetical protein
MPLIPTPREFQFADVNAVCRPWAQLKDGTHVQMGNKSAAIRQLADLLNHALARRPRVFASKAATPVQAGAITGDHNPLYAWRHYDGVKNARSYTVKILTAPSLEASDGLAKAVLSTGEETASVNVSDTALVYGLYEMTGIDNIPVTRGAEANAVTSINIATYEGYRILDVCYEDNVIEQLDTTIHDYANPILARPGLDVRADILEQMRAAFHRLRTENNPIVVNWAAARGTAGWSTSGSTGQEGIYLTNTTTYKNIFDTSITARDGSSPGFLALGYHQGLGRYDVEGVPGFKVKVTCYALASSTAGASYVKYIGPSTIASNEGEITITSGAGVAWYGPVTIYLDSNANWSESGTDANKIDVHMKTASGATLYIYGLRAWVDPF